MKRFILALALLTQVQASDPALHDAQLQVFFSPHGGCQDAVLAALGKVRKTVLVQAYSFTSAPISQALKAAHDRGVDVRVILDKSQRTQRYSDLGFLVAAGVPVAVDAKHAIAHSKIMILDGATVITGSYNFTASAENRNAENLLIIQDTGLAKRYVQNWQEHMAHAEPAGSVVPKS